MAAYLEKCRSSKGGWLWHAKGGECFAVDKQTGCVRKKQHKIMCLRHFLNSSLIQLKAKTVVLAHAWGIDKQNLQKLNATGVDQSHKCQSDAGTTILNNPQQ